MSGLIDELFSLSDRVALVTGAGSGIGRAVAEGFAAAGATVVVMGRRESALSATVDAIAAAGGQSAAVVADLSDRDELHRGVEQATVPFGDPDILVTAAGTNPRPPMVELDESVWDGAMAINLDAPFLLGQRLGPKMAARGWGRIVNVGSQQSFRAFGNSGAYGVSKAAVVALTRSQAEAWSASGVCCNALIPGMIDTPMTREVFEDPVCRDAMAARTMAGRNGVPTDLVGAAIFLASPACNFVTGQALAVDGGFSAT